MASARTYDCFTYAGEADLLDFRLSVLDGIVDVFVVVEGARSFSGKPKPLYFERDRRRFQTRASELRYIVVEDLPPPEPDRWVVERFQRDAIVRGISDRRSTDIIMVTDVDEIPSPDVVRNLDDVVRNTVALNMRSCSYKGNFQSRTEWPLARCARSTAFETAQALRELQPTDVISDAGVHFSYLMTPLEIARKYSWFAHEELDTQRAAATRHLRVMIELGVFDPSHEILDVVPLSSAHPVQVALFERHPEYFDFRTPAPRWLRASGSRWSALRAGTRVPSPLVRAGDVALEGLAKFHRIGLEAFDRRRAQRGVG